MTTAIFLASGRLGIRILGPVEVYKTYEDYHSQKMAYVIVCKREKNKVKLYELPNKSFATVIHKGMPLQILNTAFFGYEL